MSRKELDPFAITQRVADSLVEEMALCVSCQIATTRDTRDFKELYERMTYMPLRAYYEVPLPLLQEFWKWLRARADDTPQAKSLKTMATLVDGICALLMKEDQHQMENKGVDSASLAQDYHAMLHEVAAEVRDGNEAIAEWALPAFRTQRRLQKGGGDFDSTDKVDAS
jgi:hypothetical protein